MKLAAILLIAAVVQTGNSLRCYTCVYNENTGVLADCKDGAVADKYLLNCPIGVCLKVVTDVLGIKTTARSCGPKVDACTGSVCTTSCESDGCNGGNSIGNPKTNLLALMFAALACLVLAMF